MVNLMQNQSEKKKEIHKRPAPIQIFRRIVQIAAFLLFPGLFISTFAAVKDVYIALIGGTFHAAELSQQLWLLLAVMPVTMLMGRFFCGFLCAFGSMGDLFWFLARKITPKSLQVSETADRFLKLMKYAVLLFSVVVLWTLGVSLDSTMDPWTIFGMYASVTGWPSASYLLSIGAALLLLIVIGSMLVERFFCRYLCPLGAIFALLSHVRLFRLHKPKQNCGACTLCTQKCTMGIALYHDDVVKSSECIDCFACQTVCPKKNVTMKPKPMLAAVLAVAVITGLYYIGTAQSAQSSDVPMQTDVVVSDAVTAGQYQDGVYAGSAEGYKGTTTVQVTVENGAISEIQVLSTDDDAAFFNKANSSITNQILTQQSAQVDTVSGATYSSNAIINAVKNALASAGDTAAVQDTTAAADATTDSAAPTTTQMPSKASTAPAQDTAQSDNAVTQDTADDTATSTDDTAAVTDDTASQPTADTASAAGSFTDGTYTGTGTGFRGDTAVTVTVSGGNITDVTVDSYEDDKPYFERAEGTVISSILSQQTVQVDAVSGATFSSNGIMEAVANALNVSFDNPNSANAAAHGKHGAH